MGSVTKGTWGVLFGTPQVKAPITVPTSPVVARDNTSLMQRRGWKSNGGRKFTGDYATKFGTFPGEIRNSFSEWQVFIKNPPRSLVSKHPKACCMHARDGGWYLLHLHQEPCDNDPNAIVAYVERLLTEAKTMEAV